MPEIVRVARGRSIMYGELDVPMIQQTDFGGPEMREWNYGFQSFILETGEVVQLPWADGPDGWTVEKTNA